MKRLWISLLCLAASGVASAEIARLAAFAGEVDVLRAGQPQAVYPNFPLDSGDVVSTRQGTAVVRFADKTEVRVRANSRVGIAERAASREISVFAGRIWSFIARARERPTSFRSGGTIAAVRGTEIEFLANDDGSIEIGVNQGELTIRLADGTEVTLVAGQRLAIGVDGRPGPVEPHEPGQIAAAGGELQDIPEGEPFVLTRVSGMAGNNPFDPEEPSSPGQEAPRPEPTPEPAPEPTPEPTPHETPTGPTPCSEVARTLCESNAMCCRPYQCVNQECCRIVTDRCSPAGGAADCCLPSTCGFNRALGRDTCCFPEDERCSNSFECCTGNCLGGLCAQACARAGETCPLQGGAPGGPIKVIPTRPVTAAGIPCCPGLTCNRGVCEQAPSGCLPFGDPCTARGGTACCPGFACGFNGKVFTCCVPDGSACTMDAECCSGTCFGNICGLIAFRGTQAVPNGRRSQ